MPAMCLSASAAVPKKRGAAVKIPKKVGEPSHYSAGFLRMILPKLFVCGEFVEEPTHVFRCGVRKLQRQYLDGFSHRNLRPLHTRCGSHFVGCELLHGPPVFLVSGRIDNYSSTAVYWGDRFCISCMLIIAERWGRALAVVVLYAVSCRLYSPQTTVLYAVQTTNVARARRTLDLQHEERLLFI